MLIYRFICAFAVVFAFTLSPIVQADDPAPVRIGTFDVDASPPVGSPLAYDPTKGIQDPLSCRGIVLVPGAEDPIVLCAVDWIGIGGDGQTVFKEAIATAVGTTPDRVAIHALHQHDAPRCDFSAEAILVEHGLSGIGFDPAFARQVAENAAAAAGEALQSAQTVTHLGLGEGIVEKVASNRRVMGEDGKVEFVRYTATKNPKIRAKPVGTIDPKLKLISFWNGDAALAALTYYATHPQSYYRTGMATPDFPGLARNAREDATGVPHIHFNGAGGNIGAGKWNDGSVENRQILTDRVAAGMKLAWEATKKEPLSAAGIAWSAEPVLLPLADHMKTETFMTALLNPETAPLRRYMSAKNIAYIARHQAGETIPLTCLTLNKARILHLPGEPFVEYQLNAQKLRPDLFVAMAAYGDYGTGYIGTEIAYSEGGYETSERATKTTAAVEGVLMGAIGTLLDASEENSKKK